MHTSILTSVSLLTILAASPVLSQDIDNTDIPTECVVVCSNLPTVTDECDRAFQGDSDELNCICGATNAQLVISLCAACVDQYDNNDDNDNDINDLRSSCSFSTTTFDSGITYSMAAMTVNTNSASTTLTGTATTSTSTGGIAASASSRASSLSASLSSAASSLSASVSSQVASATSSAVGEATGNAAPAEKGIQGVSALAGAALLVAAAWL